MLNTTRQMAWEKFALARKESLMDMKIASLVGNRSLTSGDIDIVDVASWGSISIKYLGI